jgi:hypothetical protein
MARIIAVAAQLFWFFPKFDYHINLVSKNVEFIEPQLLISVISALVPREVFFTPSTFTVLYWATFAVGILALVGLFTRVSLFLFALGIWIFIAHGYSYGDRHHPEAVFAIFLMALAFAPSGKSFSLDALIRRRRAGADKQPKEARVDTAMWPLKLAHVLLAMTYFSTGLTKMIFGGPQWLNGYTLQAYTFVDAINRDIPLGIWLGQQYPLALGLSFFTIIFELFFFLSLIFTRAAPFIFVVGIFFQLGLYLTAGHPFFQHMVLLTLLLLFVTPQWWQAWVDKYLGIHLSRWGRQEQAQQQL